VIPNIASPIKGKADESDIPAAALSTEGLVLYDLHQKRSMHLSF